MVIGFGVNDLIRYSIYFFERGVGMVFLCGAVCINKKDIYIIYIYEYEIWIVGVNLFVSYECIWV